MKIGFALAGVALVALHVAGYASHQTEKQRRWPEAMAHSKRTANSKIAGARVAQTPAAVDSACKKKASKQLEVKWTAHDPASWVPVVEVKDARWFPDIQAVRSALAERRYADAARITQARLREFPVDTSLADLWADALIGDGRTREAYDLLAPLAIEYAMPRVLLRASLVAARLGEVYPGQANYCREQVLSHFSAFEQEIQRHLPTGESPREVELLSLLAIGVEESFSGLRQERAAAFYLNLALGIERSNPVATFFMADILLSRGQYAAAVTHYERGLPRTAGLFRQHFDQRLREAIWIRDYRE